jgi:arsenate reductase (thioredoxin)
MATALFVCLHNAGRSQMSAALFERAAGGRHRALSAGTTPAERVHPEVVAVMREPGFDIDLAGRVPQLLTDALAHEADVVVTMGCGDACPYIPGKRYIDWQLPDPKGQPIAEVRRIRDDIVRRVDGLVRELDGADPVSPAEPVARCEWCGAEYDPTSAETPQHHHPSPSTAAAAPDEPLTHCEWCGAEYPVPDPGTDS